MVKHPYRNIAPFRKLIIIYHQIRVCENLSTEQRYSSISRGGRTWDEINMSRKVQLRVIVTWLFSIILLLLCVNKAHIGTWVRPSHSSAGATDDAKFETRDRFEKKLAGSSTFKKILLFCYMRGGSTYFSEFFKQNPAMLYWYEPIDAFYTYYAGTRQWTFPQDVLKEDQKNGKPRLRLPYPDDEERALVKFNHDLMNCNYKDLPTEFIYHGGIAKSNANGRKCTNTIGALKTCSKMLPTSCQFSASTALHVCSPEMTRARFPHVWRNLMHANKTTVNQIERYVNCTENLRNSQKSCLMGMMETECSTKHTIVYKGLRLHMQIVHEFLQEDPEMFVIYLVRDPRAIIASRLKIKHLARSSQGSPVLEAHYLCQKMSSDLRSFGELRKHYPKQVKIFAYEDMVNDPMKTVDEIYESLGEEVPLSVTQWMESQKAVNMSGGIFSTRRSNPLQLINQWRKTFNHSQLENINNYCIHILEELGYNE